MLRSHVVAALTLLALPIAPATAADLTKIDRTLLKEPQYQSGSPKYCLLVFGPEANTRVWLVQDGDRLYVDRNANGDLTDEGEMVVATKEGQTDPAEGAFLFEAGDIREGTLRHRNLLLGITKIDHLESSVDQVKALLSRNPKARRYSLSLDMEMPDWKGKGLGGRVEQIVCVDAHGFLQFADKPQGAPVIHFGGPWQVALAEHHRLVIGRDGELAAGVGTPGVGPGATAFIGYEGVVPSHVHPKSEIVYRPLKEGEPPVRELGELKERC